ncbi:MAG: NUDIX hydrolase [Pseudomonadota bacterium]
MNINDFSGAKLALLAKGHVLTLLRDNKPGIAHPNMWDLPGGGREGREEPLDCALRETFEEAHLRIAPQDITWRRIYRNPRAGGLAHWFFVATPGWLTLPPARLGTEGQELRWMQIDAFLSHDQAIPHLQDRLRDYLQHAAAAA